MVKIIAQVLEVILEMPLPVGNTPGCFNRPVNPLSALLSFFENDRGWAEPALACRHLIDPPREESVALQSSIVIFDDHPVLEGDLALIIHALDAVGLGLGFRKRRQKQSDENRDHC